MKITDKDMLDELERGLREYRRRNPWVKKVTVEVDTFPKGGVRATLRGRVREARRR